MTDVAITCRQCGMVGGLDDFHLHPNGKHGRNSKCKTCLRQYQRDRRADPIRGEHARKIERKRRSTEEYNSKRRARMSVRRKSDLMYRLGARLRAMLRRSIVGSGVSKDSQTYKILGYRPEKLKQRLECQFSPGMSWGNYGDDGWHIDHKKPIDAFVKQGVRSVRTINMLCNLQPMWGSENMGKGSTWPLPIPANDNTSAVRFGATA